MSTQRTPDDAGLPDVVEQMQRMRPMPPRSLGPRIRRWVLRTVLRTVTAGYLLAMETARSFGRPKRAVGPGGYDILLTGTFHSDNWIRAHLQPLAMSRHCGRIRMVSISPLPPIAKVAGIHPTNWLIWALGPTGARLLTFIWVALRSRPHIVGGFHLLVNGLIAALMARVCGCDSLYICVGGITETLSGGALGENRIFRRLETPDPVIERRLLRAVRSFDLVVVMGSRAAHFLRARGVSTPIKIIPGGIDSRRFAPLEVPAATDLILVGRLVAVKRVDVFLEAVARVKAVLPTVRATIVGEGPLRAALQLRSHDLGLDQEVRFVGHQHDVVPWLRQAKLFVLTSDSEGLALSLMEAMMCGLPAVVSHVGDLSDLVEDGVSGYLVSDHTPEAFASKLIELLTTRSRLLKFGGAACISARRFEIAAVADLWDHALGSLGHNPEVDPT